MPHYPGYGPPFRRAATDRVPGYPAVTVQPSCLRGLRGDGAVARYRRLGKQGVGALQVVRALTRPGYGWQNHPAVRMWRGYEETPGAYGMNGRGRAGFPARHRGAGCSRPLTASGRACRDSCAGTSSPSA
jgi:hypothetical protein